MQQHHVPMHFALKGRKKKIHHPGVPSISKRGFNNRKTPYPCVQRMQQCKKNKTSIVRPSTCQP